MSIEHNSNLFTSAVLQLKCFSFYSQYITHLNFPSWDHSTATVWATEGTFGIYVAVTFGHILHKPTDNDLAPLKDCPWTNGVRQRRHLFNRLCEDFCRKPSAWTTVYPKKYAHGFVVLGFVVVMQSFIMHSRKVFIHIHQGCSAGTGAIVRLPQCQWSKPDGYGKFSQCITTVKYSKAVTVCIFLGIYFTSFISSCIINTMDADALLTQ